MKESRPSQHHELETEDALGGILKRKFNSVLAKMAFFGL